MSKPRPRWGSVDILLAFPFILAVALVGAVLAQVLAALSGTSSDVDDLPVYALVVAILFQQIGQGAWPWVVSRWKGLGLRPDWKLAINWREDITLGFGVATACVVGAGAMTALVSELVGLRPDENPSNTDILSDNQGSIWIVGIVILVVIGAPLSEELLFRGLVFRALETDLGIYVAVIGSTIMFTLPHMQSGASARESAVLLAGIAVVGLLLALVTAKKGRLGPALIAHCLFNAFGTIVALAS